MTAGTLEADPPGRRVEVGWFALAAVVAFVALAPR